MESELVIPEIRRTEWKMAADSLVRHARVFMMFGSEEEPEILSETVAITEAEIVSSRLDVGTELIKDAALVLTKKYLNEHYANPVN